jgi:hypothetical protein
MAHCAHPLERQNNVELLEVSPVLYTRNVRDSASVIPGKFDRYANYDNAMVDELGAEWVDELGNIMVDQ